MENMITVKDKKEFIRWVLKKHKLKRRECVWILNYFLSHEQLLQNIHFTDEAHYCPKAMVMTTTEDESIPFRFYKGNLMTADAEKAFHDVRLHPDEKLYIQLNFPNKHKTSQYLSILEENPHLPADMKKKISEDYSALVNEIVAELEKSNIMVEINRALDNRDEKLFAELCEMLNEVGQKKTLSFSG